MFNLTGQFSAKKFCFLKKKTGDIVTHAAQDVFFRFSQIVIGHANLLTRDCSMPTANSFNFTLLRMKWNFQEVIKQRLINISGCFTIRALHSFCCLSRTTASFFTLTAEVDFTSTKRRQNWHAQTNSTAQNNSSTVFLVNRRHPAELYRVHWQNPSL